jgi:translation elongation factor EF-1alpha
LQVYIVDYVIVDNRLELKTREQAKKLSKSVVKYSWITDSIKENLKKDIDGYIVEEMEQS